jgi:HPt (histidine-containing phosphotransfer) domain-containing protein
MANTSDEPMPLNMEWLNWMPSPSIVPDNLPINIQHLGRMTLGEPALEMEVLALFAAQSHDLASRLATLPADAAALAHTLKGSARAIGAFRVADAALGVEAAMKTNADIAKAVAVLREAVEEARTAIDRMLNRS